MRNYRTKSQLISKIESVKQNLYRNGLSTNEIFLIHLSLLTKSHEELADIIGTARPTITRKISIIIDKLNFVENSTTHRGVEFYNWLNQNSKLEPVKKPIRYTGFQDMLIEFLSQDTHDNAADFLGKRIEHQLLQFAGSNQKVLVATTLYSLHKLHDT